MACKNQVGAKNILITFTDCDTQAVIGPITHKLNDDSIPTYKTCAYANSALTNGRVQRSVDNASMTVNVIRAKGVPIAYYQGCASLAIQIEYFEGTIVSGVNGTVTDPNESDSSGIEMTVIFKELDEMLA